MLHFPITHITTPIPISFPAEEQRRLPLLTRCRRRTSGSSRVGKGMNWFHEMELQVRDYELNRFGVVKSAVYSNYCEYDPLIAGHKVAYNIGWNRDVMVALSEASYKYIAPLGKKDIFLLKTRIYDYSAARVYVESFIFKLPNLEPILESKSTIVVLDKSLRPVRIPHPSLLKSAIWMSIDAIKDVTNFILL